MSINTQVDGDPARCRVAATELRALRERVLEVAGEIARSLAVSSGAWSGVAADAFADRARRRVSRADDLAEVTSDLAAELDGMADSLESIQRQMERARSIAAGAEIPVTASSIAARGEFEMTPEQEIPHEDAMVIVASARQREEELHRLWEGALAPVLWFEWEPQPLQVSGLVTTKSPVDHLVRSVPGVRTLPELVNLPDPSEVRDFVTGIDLEDVGRVLAWPRHLPDLPYGLRYPGEIGTIKILIDAAARQQGLDEGSGHSDQVTLLRGVARGLINLSAGAGGAVLCAKVPAVSALTSKSPAKGAAALLQCEAKAREKGDEFADLFLKPAKARP